MVFTVANLSSKRCLYIPFEMWRNMLLVILKKPVGNVLERQDYRLISIEGLDNMDHMLNYVLSAFGYVITIPFFSSIFGALLTVLIQYFVKGFRRKRELTAFKNAMKEFLEINKDKLCSNITIHGLVTMTEKKKKHLDDLITGDLVYLKTDNAFSFIRTVEFTKYLMNEQIKFLDRLNHLGNDASLKQKKQLFLAWQEIILETFNAGASSRIWKWGKDKFNSDLDKYIRLEIVTPRSYSADPVHVHRVDALFDLDILDTLNGNFDK